jgi:hypothetical protein
MVAKLAIPTPENASVCESLVGRRNLFGVLALDGSHSTVEFASD